MHKSCLECSHPTNRHDNLCPNCYYIKADSDNPQSMAEAAFLQYAKLICKCGQSNHRVLILMCKGGFLVSSDRPRSNSSRLRDERALLAMENPEHWYAQCYNCFYSTRRSPGRPKKHTDEHRKWLRTNSGSLYRANLNTKVVQSYGIKGSWPGCIVCDQPATRVLYIGEFSQAPLKHRYWTCRRLALTDSHWHMQFAPYCDLHEVMSIGERARMKRQIEHQRLLETLAKHHRPVPIGG